MYKYCIKLGTIFGKEPPFLPWLQQFNEKSRVIQNPQIFTDEPVDEVFAVVGEGRRVHVGSLENGVLQTCYSGKTIASGTFLGEENENRNQIQNAHLTRNQSRSGSQK